MFYVQNYRSMNMVLDDATEFIEAASDGDVHGVKQFLDRGMSPDTTGPKGWTALRKAAVKGSTGVAYELLTRDAQVDAVNYTGQTALMMACAYGHHEVASLLLMFGANANAVNAGGHTPLMIAASFGYIRVVGALLDGAVDIDLGKTDRDGKTALDFALEYGHEQTAKLLRAAAERRTGIGTGPVSVSAGKRRDRELVAEGVV